MNNTLKIMGLLCMSSMFMVGCKGNGAQKVCQHEENSFGFCSKCNEYLGNTLTFEDNQVNVGFGAHDVGSKLFFRVESVNGYRYDLCDAEGIDADYVRGYTVKEGKATYFELSKSTVVELTDDYLYVVINFEESTEGGWVKIGRYE